MRRRSFLAGAAALPALGPALVPALVPALAPALVPAVARAASATTLRFVPQADLASLDPIWTTSYQTRDHGLMVYDTLFGTDDAYRAQPQMLEGFTTAADQLAWTLTLRAGLRFHDGTPVLARDCVASIRRWGQRDPFGQALMAATADLSAPDDRTIAFRMRTPFPLLPDALAKTPPSICAIMPERLARTDAFTQVAEVVGSGPFRYVAAERVPGSRVVYARFEGYVPRTGGAAQGTAGPKVVHFDRVEWQIIPDGSTAMGALGQGEIDWWAQPDPDLLGPLRANQAVTVLLGDPTGFVATMRPNCLQPPFDNPGVRRAVLGAISQSEFMTAMVGDKPGMSHVPLGVFCPGTPMATDAGMGVLTAPRDLARSRRELEAAGYKGETVVVLSPSDIPTAKALADVGADMMRRLGMTVDEQSMDWATLVQRRTRKEPAGQGGWSVYHTSWSGRDQLNPVGHVFLRGNGAAAGPGWPSSPALEALRQDWLAAPDLAGQQAVAARIQAQAFVDVPYVPLGQYFLPTAFRSDLTGVLKGPPIFWNVRRG